MILKMMIRLIVALGFSVSSACIFAFELSTHEQLTEAKQDIASIQMMSERCPVLIQDHAQFKQKIQAILNQQLTNYPAPSTDLRQLQQDAEYQQLFKTAQQDAARVDEQEMRLACEEVFSLD